MTRVVLAALIACATFLSAPVRPAVACTCASTDGELVEPIQGAVGVPINTTVLVLIAADGPYDVVVRAVASGEALDSSIESFADGNRAWVRITPAAALVPDSEYAVEIGGVEVGRFTTGAEADATPPDFAGLAGVTARAFTIPRACENASSCWSGSNDLYTLDLDFAEPSADTTLVVAEVFADGEPDRLAKMVLEGSGGSRTHKVTSAGCDLLDTALTAGARYCARVTAYDGAGNAAGGDVEVCTDVEACTFAENACLDVDHCVAPLEGAADAGAAGDPDSGSGGGCAASGSGAGGWAAALVLLLGGLGGAAVRRRRSASRPGEPRVPGGPGAARI